MYIFVTPINTNIILKDNSIKKNNKVVTISSLNISASIKNIKDEININSPKYKDNLRGNSEKAIIPSIAYLTNLTKGQLVVPLTLSSATYGI